MASFTSYTTTRGKPSFPHAGNYRNFETNSSINNDHVNRLYNWQQRMEQKKKMLKQKFVKENTPSFTPTKYSSKAGTSAVGRPQRAHTPTESSALQKHRERLSRARKKRERKTSSLRTRKKMDWENYKAKSTSTKLPNATTKENECPLHKKLVQSKQLQQYVQDQDVCTARTGSVDFTHAVKFVETSGCKHSLCYG